jgi:hypothetical protein
MSETLPSFTSPGTVRLYGVYQASTPDWSNYTDSRSFADPIGEVFFNILLERSEEA